MDPHIIVQNDKHAVYLTIDGRRWKISPQLARDVGDAIYKAGCNSDQEAHA